MKPLLWGLLNVAQWLLFGLWTMVWTSVAMVTATLSRSPRVGLVLARRVWAPGVLHIGGWRVSVLGAERLDPHLPWFFACNHQSTSDIPVLFTALPADLRFVAKRELRSVPFLGWYMEAMGMVFIDRARRTRAAAGIDAAASLLRQGASVVSFPAGTRRRPDEPLAFKPAAFAPALAAGVPVVPVAIVGTRGMLPPGGRVRPGRSVVLVGEPIPTAGLPMAARDEIAQATEAAVGRLLVELAEQRATAAAGLTDTELAALQRASSGG